MEYSEKKMKALAKKEVRIARMVEDGRTLVQIYWSEVWGDSAMEKAYEEAK